MGPAPTGWGDIFFVHHDTGWLTDSYRIYRTTDRAQTWEDKRTGLDGHVIEIGLMDDQFGLAIQSSSLNGERSVLKTNNAGMTWTHQTITADPVIWYGVWPQDDFRGWICGLNGSIAHTENGRQTWSVQWENRPDEGLISIQFLNTLEGFGAGVDTGYQNIYC